MGMGVDRDVEVGFQKFGGDFIKKKRSSARARALLNFRPQSLKADSVAGTAKLRHGTVENNTILSLSFDVVHDVSIHPPVQPYVYLSIHLHFF